MAERIDFEDIELSAKDWESRDCRVRDKTENVVLKRMKSRLDKELRIRLILRLTVEIDLGVWGVGLGFCGDLGRCGGSERRKAMRE